MNLVLYSGGSYDENLSLDKIALKLVNSRRVLRLTYIPADSLYAEEEFHEFVKHYKKLGVKKFLFFPIDINYSSILLEEVFKSDIIFLGGGNTFYFLKFLRRKKLFARFKDFVKRGGVLTGLSAGGIIMTPNIMTAGFPSFDKDDNDVLIKNLKV